MDNWLATQKIFRNVLIIFICFSSCECFNFCWKLFTTWKIYYIVLDFKYGDHGLFAGAFVANYAN